MDAEAEHVVSDVDKRLPKTTSYQHSTTISQTWKNITHLSNMTQRSKGAQWQTPTITKSMQSCTHDLMKNELTDGVNAGKLSHHYGDTL